MKRILIGVGIYAIVDDEDYDRVSKIGWFAKKRNVKGPVKYFAYSTRSVRWQMLPMHRFILSPKDDEVVLHLNDDQLDNRRENLKIISRSEYLKRNKTK